jgi:hypothetical protein
MSQNQDSGPQVGHTVWFTTTPGAPAILGFVTAVVNGVATITTVVGTTLTNYSNCTFDPNAVTPNSWRWPDIIAGI